MKPKEVPGPKAGPLRRRIKPEKLEKHIGGLARFLELSVAGHEGCAFRGSRLCARARHQPVDIVELEADDVVERSDPGDPVTARRAVMGHVPSGLRVSSRLR